MSHHVRGAHAPGAHLETSGPVASPARANLQLLVVGFAALAVSLSQSILVPILGTLPVELDTSATAVAWLVTSTLLVGAVSVPIMGRLGDMYGKRRMLMVAVAALTVGSLITAVTDDVGLLIVGRAIQGLSAGAIPLGISLLSVMMPPAKKAGAVALISAMLGVGGALGLPLAGYVAQNADFHALFWVTTGAGALALVGLVSLVPEAPGRSGGRLDVVGSVLLSASVVALLLPLTQSAQWGWGSARVIGLLILAVVLLGIFALHQSRTAQPLVDLRTLTRRPILLTNIASVLFGFALFASFIGTASYVEAPVESGYGFGSSLLVGGLTLLPSGLAMLVFAPIAAKLIGLRGAPFTLALGAGVVAAGWAMRIVVDGELWHVVVGATVVGIGTGIGYAAIPTLINQHTPDSEIAAANGLNTLFRSLGSSLASSIGQSLLAAQTVIIGSFAVPAIGAYRELFGICAAAAVLAAIVVLLVPRGQDLPTG